MNGYYTERNDINYEDYSNIFSPKYINENSLFRNFLINENIEDSKKKFFAPKKKEILPGYKNIKEKIENGRREIKSDFNIEKTLFRDIQAKDIIVYSQFAKNFSEYFFGPRGIITENNINLKKYHLQKQRKKKIELNKRIYAGRWLYLDENPNFVNYIARLKNNRKKILNIGGNFSTDDDFTQKLHDIFLRGARKKKQKNVGEDNTPEKNIFEFTSIGKPYNKRKSPLSPNKFINKSKINSLLQNTIPNIYEKNKNTYSNDRKNNKTMFNISSYRTKHKFKHIFLKERLLEKENRKKKKYFSNMKLTIDSKINSLQNPIKGIKERIYSIKKGNGKFDTFRENKDKYKEDIKVIGEEDKKENDAYMEEFIKKAYRLQIQDRSRLIPKKIFFTFYSEKGNTARESLKNFVKNIEKVKEMERKQKYSQTIRNQFQYNCKLIEKLGKKLDELKIKKKLLSDEKIKK